MNDARSKLGTNNVEQAWLDGFITIYETVTLPEFWRDRIDEHVTLWRVNTAGNYDITPAQVARLTPPKPYRIVLPDEACRDVFIKLIEHGDGWMIPHRTILRRVRVDGTFADIAPIKLVASYKRLFLPTQEAAERRYHDELERALKLCDDHLRRCALETERIRRDAKRRLYEL